MARNFDINVIRTFVTVSDLRSMTAAAQALNLSQGAISQQIKRLEDQIGVPLFERGKGGLRLTRAGETFLGGARQLLALNDDIWSGLEEQVVDGSVRIGLPYDLVGPLFTPVLKEFTEAYPKVEVSIACNSSPELQKMLANAELDLAVIEEPVGSTRGACLAVERLVWVGAKGGMAWRRDPLPVSLVANTCAFRPAVLAALQDNGVNWRTVFENGNIEATTATVRADLAVTTWLVSTVPDDLDILSPETGLPPLPSFSVNLHGPHQSADRPVMEFAKLLQREFLKTRRTAA